MNLSTQAAFCSATFRLNLDRLKYIVGVELAKLMLGIAGLPEESYMLD